MIVPLISKCRVCGSARLNHVFSMGNMPLANALRLDPRAENDKYPLTLLFCEDCSLVQIREDVDKEVLFSKDYVYYSSQSKTMVESSRILAEGLIQSELLDETSLVMEAASNDGYLLQHYVNKGVRVIGFDPAEKTAEVAKTKGVPTRIEFFGTDAARGYTGEVDVFHANNVLAHTSNQNDFVAGIAKVLKDTGVAVIEVPYLGHMIDRREFDTIYHEHLCYFSLTALSRLFSQHGMAIAKVEELPIHGGSLRIFAKRGKAPPDYLVRSILAREQRDGMHLMKYYSDFGERVNRLGTELWRTFDRIHRKMPGAKIAGYGAAAKGNQLLSYFDIDFLEYVVDSTPAKQGKYMAGVPTPIVSPQNANLPDQDYVLLLAWNFKKEIMAKHPEYKGAWIIPVPNVVIE
jgi:SAM-dependent methyltransferase